MKLDLYGSSDKEDYEKISNMYSIYSVVGGYPAVVVNLKETGDIRECRKIISSIIRIFCEESSRYFDYNIIDVNIFNHILRSITRLLANEKKGFKEDSFNEALQKVVRKEYSSNISKDVCHRATNWLERAGYCNKIIK